MKDSAQQHYEYMYFLEICETWEPLRYFPHWIDIEYYCSLNGNY